MQKIFEVVVIGCGISGIAASYQLSKAGVDHIVLESRARIGGRIASQSFQGGTVHTGASFVHCPQQNNRIANLVREWGWKTVPAGYESVQYFLEGQGEAEQKVVQQAEELTDGLMESIEDIAAAAEVDISLEEAARGFLEGVAGRGKQVQSIIKWNLNILGNIEGAELREISAKQFQNDQNADDFIPVDGYLKIIQKIIDLHKPTVEMNHKVTKIDYSCDPIKVYTQNQVYLARRVICSLPLGVLQRNIVQFCPTVPQSHRQAIGKMGNGVANKIFAIFSQPFWDQSKLWVNFVSKGQNRYPVALSMLQEGQGMLCFFVSGDASKELSELSNSEIQQDLLLFLKGFSFNREVEIKEILVTRWHQDSHSYGSYSYLPVGTTVADINTLRTPIMDKLWFIGEHCHPEMNACAHAAFQTGIWAALQVIASLSAEK